MRAPTQWEEMPVTPDMLEKLKFGRYRAWARVRDDGQDLYVVIHSTDDDEPDEMTTGSVSIPAALKVRGL